MTQVLLIALLLPVTLLAHAGEDHPDIQLDIVRKVPVTLPSLSASIQSCLTLSTPIERNNCFALLCTPSYDCVQALIIHATLKEGPVIGIRTLDDLLMESPRFGLNTDGHELGHIIGRTHAKVHSINGNAFIECPVDYLYACQHGYFEQALGTAEEKTPKDIAEEICEGITTEPRWRSRFYCYHGVGHGIMMAMKNDPFASIRFCDTLSHEQAAQGCWQGVFMENINAVQSGLEREGVFFDDDPLAPCSRIPLTYQWQCYESQAANLMKVHSNDITAAAKECLKANPSVLPSCILSLAQFVTNPGWQTVIVNARSDDAFVGPFSMNTAVKICQSFPLSTLPVCYMAAIGNAMNYNQFQNATDFCSMIEEDYRRACYQKISNEWHYHGRPQPEIGSLCEQFIPKEFQDTCAAIDESEQIVHAKAKAIEAATQKPGVLSKLVAIISWPLRFFSNTPPPPLELPSLGPSMPPPASSHSAGSGPSAASAQTSSRALIGTVLIRLTGQSFDPTKVTISAGETVTWINETEELFWPASDVHPTHELLPVFDAKRPLQRSQTFSFTFTEPGDWTFHDHLSPWATGVVHVK
ncbi:hypothetical protein HYZ98_03320 [Candidatus Peregrinibacteria bacterium]|nr:hypothetical protein [Candidatus Peregrinibacteria bacterium]